jgi:tetratricopeptide (TPR) repeat protein
MVRRFWIQTALFLALGSSAWAESAAWVRAYTLYQQTDYSASLSELLPLEKKDAAAYQLIGQNEFMLGEYHRATESLEYAVGLAPDRPDGWLWLGRTFGRRAETSSPFTAPGYAAKARQMFERAVALDPANREAVGDLFEYYLEAPGFLGGGESKAAALAAQVARQDPAEGHYYAALIDQERKQYDSAERHLRAALELAPRQVGRVLALARYLGLHGRAKESDALFEEAERIAPETPKVLFERAQVYIRTGRNLDEARRLLRRYLRAPLTPGDPPRSGAEALLKKIGA